MKYLKQYGLIAGSVFIILAGLGLVAVLANKQPEPKKQNLPEFIEYAAGKKRKEAFLSYLLPLIETRNAEIAKTRKQLQFWHQKRDSLSAHTTRKVQQWAQDYGLRDFDASNEQHWKVLLRRVDVVPPSLALAQAANESAWGTSRFAREANNYYGQWCFSKGCGLVPKQRTAGLNHEVAKFDSPTGSINSYIRNLNRNPAYKELRKMRASMRAAQLPLQGVELVKGLGRYSERGKAYVQDLQALIRHNQLQRFDQIKS